MSRHSEIKSAYKSLGGEATFYDGMITCSTLPGKAVCRLVWNMDKKKNDRCLDRALSGIPKGSAGTLLEVPVGTGAAASWPCLRGRRIMATMTTRWNGLREPSSF